MLLFLPGIDGTGGAGATQWPRLGSQFEVHALSFDTEDRSSFAEVVDSVCGFLEERPNRAAMLVGESTGALAALAAAWRAPQRVSALCLVNPATSYTGSPLSALAPLLPSLPRALYDVTPAVISPLFGKANWFRTVVKPEAAPKRAPLLPLPADLVAASAALADVLPPGALAHRLQSHLADGAAFVNAELSAKRNAPAGGADGPAVLLLAGGRDLILPSVDETTRLAGLLSRDSSLVVRKALSPC